MNEQGVDEKININTRKFTTQKEIDKRMAEYFQQFRPKELASYYDEELKKTVRVFEAAMPLAPAPCTVA